MYKLLNINTNVTVSHKQKHGIIFLVFLLWLISIVFATYPVISTYSLDNLLAPLLLLLFVFLPRQIDQSALNKRVSTIAKVGVLYFFFTLITLVSFLGDNELLMKFAWEAIKDGLYLFVPMFYIRDYDSFRAAISALIVVTIIAALSAILAALGILELDVQRFAESRIGDGSLQKSIGLLSSYGDVAILYAITILAIYTMPKHDLKFGFSNKIIQLAVFVIMFAGLVGSQSRNMLLTSGMSFIICVLAKKYARLSLSKRTTFIITYALLLFMLAGLFVVVGGYISDFISGMGGDKAAHTAETRLSTFAIALDLISKQPIMGVDLNIHHLWGEIIYSLHNMWLKIMLNGGVLSLMFFMGIFYIAFSGAKRLLAQGNTTIAPILMSLIFSIIIATQFYGGLSSVMWVALSFTLSSSWLGVKSNES